MKRHSPALPRRLKNPSGGSITFRSDQKPVPTSPPVVWRAVNLENPSGRSADRSGMESEKSSGRITNCSDGKPTTFSAPILLKTADGKYRLTRRLPSDGQPFAVVHINRQVASTGSPSNPSSPANSDTGAAEQLPTPPPSKSEVSSIQTSGKRSYPLILRFKPKSQARLEPNDKAIVNRHPSFDSFCSQAPKNFSKRVIFSDSSDSRPSEDLEPIFLVSPESEFPKRVSSTQHNLCTSTSSGISQNPEPSTNRRMSSTNNQLYVLKSSENDHRGPSRREEEFGEYHPVESSKYQQQKGLVPEALTSKNRFSLFPKSSASSASRTYCQTPFSKFRINKNGGDGQNLLATALTTSVATESERNLLQAQTAQKTANDLWSEVGPARDKMLLREVQPASHASSETGKQLPAAAAVRNQILSKAQITQNTISGDLESGLSEKKILLGKDNPVSCAGNSKKRQILPKEALGNQNLTSIQTAQSNDFDSFSELAGKKVRLRNIRPISCASCGTEKQFRPLKILKEQNLANTEKIQKMTNNSGLRSFSKVDRKRISAGTVRRASSASSSSRKQLQTGATGNGNLTRLALNVTSTDALGSFSGSTEKTIPARTTQPVTCTSKATGPEQFPQICTKFSREQSLPPSAKKPRFENAADQLPPENMKKGKDTEEGGRKHFDRNTWRQNVRQKRKARRTPLQKTRMKRHVRQAAKAEASKLITCCMFENTKLPSWPNIKRPMNADETFHLSEILELQSKGINCSIYAVDDRTKLLHDIGFDEESLPLIVWTKNSKSALSNSLDDIRNQWKWTATEQCLEHKILENLLLNVTEMKFHKERKRMVGMKYCQPNCRRKNVSTAEAEEMAAELGSEPEVSENSEIHHGNAAFFSHASALVDRDRVSGNMGDDFVILLDDIGCSPILSGGATSIKFSEASLYDLKNFPTWNNSRLRGDRVQGLLNDSEPASSSRRSEISFSQDDILEDPEHTGATVDGRDVLNDTGTVMSMEDLVESSGTFVSLQESTNTAVNSGFPVVKQEPHDSMAISTTVVNDDEPNTAVTDFRVTNLLNCPFAHVKTETASSDIIIILQRSKNCLTNLGTFPDVKVEEAELIANNQATGSFDVAEELTAAATSVSSAVVAENQSVYSHFSKTIDEEDNLVDSQTTAVMRHDTVLTDSQVVCRLDEAHEPKTENSGLEALGPVAGKDVRDTMTDIRNNCIMINGKEISLQGFSADGVSTASEQIGILSTDSYTSPVMDNSAVTENDISPYESQVCATGGLLADIQSKNIKSEFQAAGEPHLLPQVQIAEGIFPDPRISATATDAVENNSSADLQFVTACELLTASKDHLAAPHSLMDDENNRLASPRACMIGFSEEDSGYFKLMKNYDSAAAGAASWTNSQSGTTTEACSGEVVSQDSTSPKSTNLVFFIGPYKTNSLKCSRMAKRLCYRNGVTKASQTSSRLGFSPTVTFQIFSKNFPGPKKSASCPSVAEQTSFSSILYDGGCEYARFSDESYRGDHDM